MTTKVFGLGVQKTGTSSLRSAYRILGLSTGSWMSGRFSKVDEAETLELALQEAHAKDACANNPWPKYYKELLETFPDAKFILTVRDENAWVKSCQRYFEEREWPELEWFYGHSKFAGNEEHFRQVMRDHNQAVIDHFAEQGKELLIFNPSAGDGWEELCGFLDLPIPEEEFPCSNVGGSFRSHAQRRYIPYIAAARKMLGLGQ